MSTRLPHDIASWTDEARRAGAVIAGAFPEKRDAAQSRQDSLKAELLSNLDQQLAELTRQIDAQRAVAGVGGNSEHIAALEQRSAQLLSVRQNVEGATSLAVLSQLRSSVTEATRAASETVQASATTIAASGGTGATFAARQIAQAEFHARMQGIERQAAPLVAQSVRLQGEAEATAKRLGLDTGAFSAMDDELRRSAARKRRNGDRVGAMEDDTLAAWNTANHWDEIAANAKTEQERQQAERKAAEARASAEKQEELYRKAVEAEVKKEAAKGTFSTPEEKAAWEKAHTEERMKSYQEKKAQLDGMKGLSPEQAKEEVARRSQARAQMETVAVAEGQEAGFAESKASTYTTSERAGLQPVALAPEAPTSGPEAEEHRAEAKGPLSALRSAMADAKRVAEANPAKGSGVDTQQVEKPNTPPPQKSAEADKGPVRST